MRSPAVFVFALCSCVGAPRVIELPPTDRAATAVYVIAAEGVDPIVVVADLAPTSETLPELSRQRGERIELYAFHYGCPIDVLGLKKGRQALAAEGHPIPPAQAALTSVLSDEGQSAWAAIDQRAPEAIRAIRIEREIRCARFRMERIAIPGTGSTSTAAESLLYPTFAVPLDADTLLVAINNGQFFRVTRSTYEPVDMPPDTPHLTYFQRDDGTLYFYGPRGRFAQGHIDSIEGPWTPLPESPRRIGSYLAWLAGPTRSSEPLELFMLNEGGVFARFDGTAWTELDFTFVRANDLAFGGVAYVAPGEAVAVTSWYEEALRFKNGMLTREQVLPPSSGSNQPSLRAVAEVGGMGTVAGTSGGRLFVDSGAGWTQLLDSPLQRRLSFGPKILDIVPLDDGAFFGGGSGHFSQFQPELGEDGAYCDYNEDPPVEGLVTGDALAQFHTVNVEVLPCGYALLSKQLDWEGDVEITFLTRTQ
jgi:hypothetical protein